MWLFDYVIKEDGKKKAYGYDEEIFYISNDTLYKYRLNKKGKNLNDWSEFLIIKKNKDEHSLYSPENENEKEYATHFSFKYVNDTTMVFKSKYDKLELFFRLINPTDTKINTKKINNLFHKNQFKTNLSYLDKKYDNKIQTVSFLNPFNKLKNNNEIPAFVISKNNYHFIYYTKAKRNIFPIINFNKKGFSIGNIDSKEKVLEFIKTK